MSGHSHWSTIKRQKKAEDAKKSKLFAKLSKALTVAVREGKGNTDPDTNPRLRLAVEQARLANMSKDSIQRAIRKGSKIGERGELEPVVMGGFILSDTALLIEGITDNRKRTISQIKKILEARGGTLAAPESIEPYFERVGLVTIAREGRGEEECLELALEVGAQDFRLGKDHLQLITTPHKFSFVRERLARKGIKVEKATRQLQSKIANLSIDGKERDLLSQVIEQLEDHDDITKVYTNASLEMAQAAH